MKERPILFSPSSVAAILEGRKTQTRRVVRPQPHGGFLGWVERGKGLEFWFQSEPTSQENYCPYGLRGDRLWVKEPWGIAASGGRLIDPCLNYRAGGQRPLIARRDLGWSMPGSSHEADVADLLKIEVTA